MEREESGLELHPEGGLALWRPLSPATCLAESYRITLSSCLLLIRRVFRIPRSLPLAGIPEVEF